MISLPWWLWLTWQTWKVVEAIKLGMYLECIRNVEKLIRTYEVGVGMICMRNMKKWLLDFDINNWIRAHWGWSVLLINSLKNGEQEAPLRIRLKFWDKCLYLNIFTRHIKVLTSLEPVPRTRVQWTQLWQVCY